MEIKFDYIVLVSASACIGLVAGLLFAFSCSVIPGFKTLPDAEYISAMQAINKAIQNPLFFTVFLGCLLLLPLCCYLNYSSVATSTFRLLVAATVIYIAGVFGTTVLGNIPLNNTLEKFNLAIASKDEIIKQRQAFENRWNGLHYSRTVAAILSFVLIIIACIDFGKR